MSASVTLVVGSEDLLVERAIDRAHREHRAVVPDAGRDEIDASDPAALSALRQALAPALFGGASTVVMRNADGASEELLEFLLSDECAHAIDDADGAVVLLHPAGVKGKKILTALRAKFPETSAAKIGKGRKLNDFVAAEFAAAKRKITSDTVNFIVRTVGSDVRELASACAQLASDVDANPITIDDVMPYFDGVAEVTGFQIADAVMSRQPAAVLRQLRWADSDQGRLGPAAVAAVARSVRQLAIIATAPPGVPPRELATMAGVPEWKIRDIKAQARKWRPEQIARALVILRDSDAASKGGLKRGEQLDPAQKDLALERALLALAAGT